MGRIALSCLALTLALAFQALPAAAQDAAADRKRMDQLEKRLQELEEGAKEVKTDETHWYDRLKILGFEDATATEI